MLQNGCAVSAQSKDMMKGCAARCTSRRARWLALVLLAGAAHFMAPCVLTIEDDHAIRRGIVDALHYAGYRTLEAADVRRGGRLAVEACYDLLLLDLVLPDGDGLAILARVRQVQPTVPVIVLTARGDESDRVAGLRQGADDYVVKPFSVRELLARIEAVLRRTPGRPLDVRQIRLACGMVDLERREVCFNDGGRHELSAREAELLRYLAVHRARAVGRDELLANVWRLDPQGLATRTIDMHVARLREKLRDDPARPQVLVTVRGKGYMLAAAEVRSESRAHEDQERPEQRTS